MAVLSTAVDGASATMATPRLARTTPSGVGAPAALRQGTADRFDVTLGARTQIGHQFTGVATIIDATPFQLLTNLTHRTDELAGQNRANPIWLTGDRDQSA
ncbi:hypothetical protein GCM10010344_10270 [Streptomyces bluensis]|nr:hypothetical protein GCM10010344_10270 [Streptomyces bluensis]